MHSRLAVLMVADLVDYSVIMSDDETLAINAIRDLKDTYLEPTALKHGGEILKRMGDGWIIAFSSVAATVQCAMEVQTKLVGHLVIRLRIGAHIGEIREDETDFYGAGINLAQRLQTQAPPGGLMVSEDLHRQLTGELSKAFKDAGSFKLKNIALAVNGFQWRPQHGDSLRTGELARGRKHCEARAWADAYDSLSRADVEIPLEAKDLELLAQAAYLIGQEDVYLKVLERAHYAYLDADEITPAAQCAFWLGLILLFRGETGQGTGWLASAERLIEGENVDCVVEGYLLLPKAEQLLGANDNDTAYAVGADAVEIGSRFGDADLVAVARHIQGRALLKTGRIGEGLTLLDEAMVAVTSGGLSPLLTGLIYCSVIEACQQIYAFGRAREWTSALALWCKEQSQLVAFTGVCLVHRAEIMQLHGSWRDAIEEAQRACERFAAGHEPQTSAAAFYQQGEVHRLRGEYGEAEEAYTNASRWGWDPQPGLALLRLAQNRSKAAAAAIRRIVDETTGSLERTKLLPAYVEIMLALDETDDARAACRELEGIAQEYDAEVFRAMAAHARGAVNLAGDDAPAALGPLRDAWRLWRQVKVPYLAARVRVLIGLACREIGDEDGSRLELAAARAEFEQLGASPDIDIVDLHTKLALARNAGGLTRRELQVLRLVANGKTNKAIASELSVSQKTIDRHLSNIFTKLDVPSRAAATAYVYEHNLLHD